MSKYILAILLFFSAEFALAGKHKIAVPGKADVYVPTFESDGRTLNVESLNGPGTVPLGGMVAVMPAIQSTDAWQPPATGVIKDGFMRADGHTITAQNVASGSKLRQGTVLPSMTAKYLRGNTTSGATGGANTQALIAANIPQVSTSYTPAGSVSGSATSGGVDHTHAASHYGWVKDIGTGGQIVTSSGNWTTSTDPTGTASAYLHTHSLSASFSGTGATITVGSGAPTAVNNEPAYVETIWVIRVK